MPHDPAMSSSGIKVFVKLLVPCNCGLRAVAIMIEPVIPAEVDNVMIYFNFSLLNRLFS